MPSKVRLSSEAKRNVVDISGCIAKESPTNAKKWRDDIRRVIKSLASFPQRHQVIYTPDQASREVHQTLFGAYRILYSVEENRVFVLTIRHSARKPIGPSEVEGIE